MIAVDAAASRIVELPLDATVTSASHTIASVSNVVVEVAAGGHRGIGYAVALSAAHARAVDELSRDLAERLVGTDSSDIRGRWLKEWEALNFLGQAGPGVAALAAVDTALWDLKARVASLPLYGLLGGIATPLPVYATGGWLSSTPTELLEEAQRHIEAGHRWFKMKVGIGEADEDTARVRVVRDAFPDLGIMVDANQGWSASQAITAGRKLQELGLVWLEEPVDVADVEGSAAVAAALDVPICAGETAFGAAGVRHLVEAGAVDVLNPDLMRCGGVSGLLDVISYASVNRVPVTPHTFIETGQHVLAGTGRSGFLEMVPGWWDRLFTESPVVEDGHLTPPSGPGLGVTLSEEALQRFTIRQWTTPGFN